MEATSFDLAFWVTCGIIFLLLMLSGFFSGSETALTAASRARMHQLAQRGNRRARATAHLIEDKERLIGAILLGNNLVNILATALATAMLTRLVGEAGIAWATLIMTVLVLIFAEVLPKSYAIQNADKLSLTVSPIIRVAVTVFSPIVSVVRFIVRLTLRAFGVSSDGDVLSPADEIRGTIDLHNAEGGIVKEDRDMLGSILDLDNVVVEDVMIHRSRMEMIDINVRPEEVVARVIRSSFTRLPLYDGEQDNIVGVLHAKDVLRAIQKGGAVVARLNIRRIMLKPWFVPETTSLREQLNAFLERRQHFALVVDEYGDLQGLVTLEDILEEIVGDITDEHDFELQGVQQKDDGSILVDGSVTIRDLNRMFDWTLPDEEATTLAGLVLYEAETIPIVGQTFRFQGFQFEVTGRRRNQITQVKMRRIKTGKPL